MERQRVRGITRQALTSDLQMLKPALRFCACIALCFSIGDSKAHVNVELLCFTSAAKPAIRFELRTYYDVATKFAFGFVKYEKAAKPVPIVQSQVEARSESKNAPDEISTEWIEINQLKPTGRYLLTSQGASVISMTYERIPNGRNFNFEVDPNTSSSVQGGCKWNE